MFKDKAMHMPKCPTLKALIELEAEAFSNEKYLEDGIWEKAYLIIRQRYNWRYALIDIGTIREGE